MVKKLYSYLEEENVLIDAPQNYVNRVEKNFDENPNSGKEDLTIKVLGFDPVKIVKDKKYPFAWTSENNSREHPGIDFFRYGTKTQTTFVLGDDEYLIESHLPGDESGILRVVKKWYLGRTTSKQKALLHASLVRLGSEGILMLGKSFSGKTSLTLGFLEHMAADFVAEENTLIEEKNGELLGFYLPRPIHVRLKLIYDSPGLVRILKDFSITEATQNVDEDYIQRLISSNTFDLDASIDIARRNFARLLGIKTVSRCKVSRIIFPEYSTGEVPKITRINPDEAYELLRESEIQKNQDIGRLKKAYETEEATIPLTQRSWIEGKTCFRISFSGYKSLNRGVIEDLIS